MPKKKNQHYVPQFYLRNFSIEGSSSKIGLYVKEKEYFFNNASISHQASKDYFYGKNLAGENLLGRIESKTKPIISKIIKDVTLPENQAPEHLILMGFLGLSSLRTLSATETVDEAIEKSNRIIFGNAELTPKELKNKDKSPGLLIINALESTPLLMDLKLKLLINKTSKPFVTSDHPAVKYNLLFENKDSLGGHVGLACKGLKIFLPLTPKLLLVAFDKDIYQFGISNNDLVEIDEIKDVVSLNSLQMINSNSTVYFNQEMTKEHLSFLKKRNEKYFFKERSNVNEFIATNNKSSLIRWHPKEIKCNLKLSFLRLTKEGIKFELDERTVYVRDMKMVLEVKRIRKQLRKNRNNLPVYLKVLLS